MSTLDFFDVEVRSMGREADGVLSLALQHPLGDPLPAWEPGAHIDVLLPNGLLRQYSLCSEPGDPRWRVAVLHEKAGRGGSAFVHEELRPGSKVQVRAPRNNFSLAPAAEYLFIAGGIGITPVLPMVRAAAASGAPWRLVYLGRSRRSMAFLGELPDGGTVTIHADDEGGRFPLASLLGAAGAQTHLYVCGPGPLLGAVQELTAPWDGSRVHFERFAADPAAASPAAGPGEGPDGGSSFDVELADGAIVEVPAGTTILEALEAAGRFPLSSCREGICGTCETPVVSGEIDHRDSLLSGDERAAGDTMMICVSRCRGQRLVLDL
ncbi:PDR/VanB family oxidoreductase [Arthrobacter cavernae]|uniref:Oxidoreductase n=1 Tax=Arthrobacter cavernae TaxID=2817681 RepID=A0A939HH84_9MICC|nr:PDR/VanB family oxidoreductase [Arthrobacter cavernae]MBO1268233.1 oxidoreductase [Arthrobacter cavernae]